MRRSCWIGLLALTGLVGGATSGAESQTWIDEAGRLSELVEVYREFHRNPELSLHEEQTAARLAAALRKAGIEVTTGIGGHGLVGILKNGEGPTVLVRTDLDALPVTEETGLEYASQVKQEDDSGAEVGVMHACGHDIHITNLIAVAQYLAANKDAWQGTVLFLGQPAEEKGAGARAMLDDGLFKKFPLPDFALAVHVDSTLAAGQVKYRAGYALANVDSVDVTLRGRGGHGAYPHTTIDPIVMAAHFIVDLQTLVSREVPPLEPAVVTVGSIHGGTKHNIIGDSCHLQITVRSLNDAVRAKLLAGVRRKAFAAAASADAPEPIVRISEGTPAMFNNERLVDRLVPVLGKAIGEEKVQMTEPSMGGEDFSEYGRAGVPIFMWRVGSIEPERLAKLTANGGVPPSLHSSKYFPDAEPTLRTAFLTVTAAVQELMPRKP